MSRKDNGSFFDILTLELRVTRVTHTWNRFKVPMSATDATAAAKVRPYGDLKEAISIKDCYCLNEDPNKSFHNLFRRDETLHLQSDADGTPM